MIAIVTLAVALESATEVAVSVIVGGFGACAGAVYVMAVPEREVVVESVPHAFVPQFAPVMLQITPLFCASFCTLAVKLCDWFTPSACTCGDTLTWMGAAEAEMVITAEADLAVLNTDVAIRVMEEDVGICAGAV